MPPLVNVVDTASDLLKQQGLSSQVSISLGFSFSAGVTTGFSGGFSLFGGNPISRMESVGHSVTHFRHSLHFTESIKARLLLMVIASYGQTFKHLVQPMQATAQFLFAIPPLSSFMQAT